MTIIWITAFAICAVYFLACRKKVSQAAPSAKGTAIEEYGFSVRDHKIWYHDQPVEGMDPKSFQVIDDYYAKDATQLIFYQTYRDSRSYYLTKKNEVHRMPEADPGSFVSLELGYGRDKTKAYYQGVDFPVKDVTSLTILNAQFAKDDKAAYIERDEIKGSQGSSFELVGSIYAKDAKQVYYYQFSTSGKPDIQVISNSPQSFTVIDHPYARDERSIFYFGEKLSVRNPESFKVLGSGYSLDREQVYYEAALMKDADASSFSIFPENQNFTGEGAYAKDAHSVYYRNHSIPSVDVGSFAILNEHYAKDRNHVYFQDKILKGCDVQTFEVFPHDMGDADAKDKNHHYHLGKRVAQD